jgi:hypothetical protein
LLPNFWKALVWLRAIAWWQRGKENVQTQNCMQLSCVETHRVSYFLTSGEFMLVDIEWERIWNRELRGKLPTFLGIESWSNISQNT